jgi:predicted CoA-binding protein
MILGPMPDEPIGTPPSPLAPDPETGPAAPSGSGERGARDRLDRDRARAFLALHEGPRPVPVLDDAGIAVLLRATRRIAVIGASDDPDRPSYDVFRYLRDERFDCVPVNPNVREVLGVPAFPSLRAAVAATGPFDIVDVFRRSDLCVPHARDAVEAGARCLWLQLGVVSWEAARIAHEAGLAVVMDRCTAIEWRRLAPDPPDVSR